MNTFDTILARCSVRSFTDETPSADLLRELCADSPYLAVVDPAIIGSERVGTYGVITGRPAYVAAVGDPLQAGIAGEKLVIELTRRGFGTCWLGATFSRAVANKALQLSDNKDIIAAIAIGTATKMRRPIDWIMHVGARGGSRKPMAKLILDGQPADNLAEAVEAMRWAPSAYNRQPWRFAFRPDGAIEVHGLAGDYLLLDCGIAIAHFLLLKPDYELSAPPAPRPDLTPIATLQPTTKS
ncbi:MAG: nitroreductase family protein [Muribaculaceae bacterium]